MSTRIMSLVWPLQMSAAQKAVLVSLADQANDDGVCWPSVTTLCERTCLSPRSVQRALACLIESGFVAVDQRSGRSTIYRISVSREASYSQPNPRHSVTPVTVSPPSQCHPHPRQSDGGPPSQWHPTPVTVTGLNRKGTVKEPLTACPEQTVSAAVGAEQLSPRPTGIPLKNGESWWPSDAALAKYRMAFPGCDVAAQLRRMVAWCEANPKRRKTPAGIERMVQSWLARAELDPRQRRAASNPLMLGEQDYGAPL